MRLAIKGHSTRGKEVIELLEMLGGKNPYNYKGNYTKYYLISKDNSIYLLDYLPNDVVAYTLEEFEELYPYKVGDKVMVRGYKEQGVDEITSMIITYDNDVKYKTKNHRDTRFFTADSFKSTENKKDMDKINKEEDMSDLKNYGTATIKYIQENGSRDMELIIPYNQEIVNINGRYILRNKKPQYQKTYEECYDILGLLKPSDDSSNIYGYKTPLLSKFQKLLICRDAYWKIAGEEMGLDKPWEPDWCDYNPNAKFKYIITTIGDDVVKDTSNLRNYILAFPTEEMRDAFYENFKDLIEQCKELL